jgi:hypothetical protein
MGHRDAALDGDAALDDAERLNHAAPLRSL